MDTIEPGEFDLIIGDLPFVSARADDEEERAFFDMRHKEHETLFKAVRGNRWLAPRGCLVTAFSTLGGPNDVRAFEGLIRQAELTPVLRTTLYESGYGWMVYVLMRAEEVSPDDYWWGRLVTRA